MFLFWLIYLKVFAILILFFNDGTVVKISFKNNTLEVTTVFNPDTDLGRSNKHDEETEMPSSFISNDIINSLFIKNLIIISYIRIHSRRHYCF